MKKAVFVTIFTCLLLVACNTDADKRSSDTSTAKSLTTTKQQESPSKSSPKSPKHSKEALNQQGEKLADIYCKCKSRPDVSQQQSCQSKVERAYKTISDQLDETKRNDLQEAYHKGLADCS